MLRKYTRPVVFLGIIIFSLFLVISCEEDFTDINSSVVTNSKFITGDTVLEVEITGKDIERVQADALALGPGVLGQYLLGVFNNANYEKIEASIISQISIPENPDLVIGSYGADTTVATTVDAVLLRIPYQVTLESSTSTERIYTLDSIIGNQEASFTLNVYRLSTFLNDLNPTNPSVRNQYFSDYSYDLVPDNLFPEHLNVTEDLQFKPNRYDSIQVISRKLNSGVEYAKDTVRYENNVPYISIPLKGDIIQDVLLSQYETANFESQEVFNNYFRGIMITAEGNDGSLISLDLSNTTHQPMIDVYYTNTVIKGGTEVIDTIKRNDEFLLSGVRNSQYKMTAGQAPSSHQFALQGTAGTSAQVKIFGDDTDDNDVFDVLEVLRTKDWLINDATLTLYVDENIVGSDTIVTPSRLFIFRDQITSSNEEVALQTLDYLTEGPATVGGFLTKDDMRNPDRYTFNITDYVSELVAGRINNTDLLGVKVSNPTDFPVLTTDVVVRSYNWNPQAVMLLNGLEANGERKAVLKISYSKRIEN